MSGQDAYTSESDFTEYWVDWFLGSKGNEYFCDVDFEYITDRFNLTGLNAEISNMQLAIDIITDNCKLSDIEDNIEKYLPKFRGTGAGQSGQSGTTSAVGAGAGASASDEDKDGKKQELKEQVEYSARLLYGLIHARYILTNRGLQKMAQKYKNADFGYCPRVYCKLQPLLPIGLEDQPGHNPVKLYCANCEDLYNPKSTRHGFIDGAFFGTSFPGMFFQTFPNLVPTHQTQMWCPKLFGFQLHEHGQMNRWRKVQYEKTVEKVEKYGLPVKDVPGGFTKEV